MSSKSTMITLVVLGIAALFGAAPGTAQMMGSIRSDEAAAPRLHAAVAGSEWAPALAPFAHVRHCLEYPEQCRRHHVSIRKGRIAATPARHAELARVNRTVNRQIRPSEMFEGPTGDTWTIAPKAGDCDDYAVTKRKLLLDAGWPSSALLLAHTVAAGRDHLVLVVRMRGGDVVLDNLVGEPRPAVSRSLPIVKIQSPVQPEFWIRPASQLVAGIGARRTRGG